MGEKIIHGIHRFLEILEIVLAAVIVLVLVALMGIEIWELEDCIYDLISQCEEVLSDTPLFFAVNSYTTGLSPAVMEYMLKTTLVPRFGGETSCDEIGLPVSATGGVVPCGATAIWEE